MLLFYSCHSGDIENGDLIIISRKDWGSVSGMKELPEHTISFITIHHGGVIYTGEKETAKYLREFQVWCRDKKKWMDIPYHYLMDLEGKIYQGRPIKYPGDTNTDYDPTGHLLICVLGNYEEQKLNKVQYDNLVNLLVYFCNKYDVTAQTIKGHKDYTETACPGENIYRILRDKSLINSVEKKMNK